MGCNCGGSRSAGRTAAAGRARATPVQAAGCGTDEPLYVGPLETKKIWIAGDELFRQEQLTEATTVARREHRAMRVVYASQLCQSVVDSLYGVQLS